MAGFDKERLRKYAANIAFVAALSVAVLIVVYIYVIPYVVAWGEYKGEIVARAKQMTGRELVIDGSIDFSAFPTPRFYLNGVRLKNHAGGVAEDFAAVGTLEVYPSPLYLIFNTVKIGKIVLRDASIFLENYHGREPNWLFHPEGELADNDWKTIEKNVSSYFQVSTVIIENTKISYSSGDREKPVKRSAMLRDSRLKLNSLFGELSLSGEASPADGVAPLEYELEFAGFDELHKGAKTVLKLNSDDTKLAIDGSIFLKDAGPVMSGAVSGHAGPSMRIFSGDAEDAQESSSRALFAGLLSQKPELAGKMEISKSGMSVKDAVIAAGKLRASGEMRASFGAQSQRAVKLLFDAVNVDEIMDGYASMRIGEGNTKAGESGSGGGAGPQSPLGFLIDFFRPGDAYASASLDLTAKNATYRGHQFQEISIDMELGSDRTLIRSLKARGLPGDGEAVFLGKPAQGGDQYYQGQLKILLGDMTKFLVWLGRGVSGTKDGVLKNFRFDAGISLTPGLLQVDDAAISMDGMKAGGRAHIKLGEEKTANVALRMDVFDLDAYLPESAGTDKKPDLNASFSKFDTLRTIDIYFDKMAVAMAADQFVYNGKKTKNLSAVVKLQPGVLQVEQLSLQDDVLGEVRGNFSVDSRELNPVIGADIYADRFMPGYFSELTGISLLRPIEDADNIPKKDGRWKEDSIFDTDVLDIISGQVKFSAGKASYNGFDMEELEAAFNMNRGSINVDYFRGKAFDSKVEIGGSIGISPPSLNASVSVVNADLEKLLKPLLGIGNISGRCGITGNLATIGYTPVQWLSSLQGNMELISRGIVFGGADFSLLGRKIPGSSSARDVAYWFQQALSSGQTKFDYVSGSLAIAEGSVRLDGLRLSGAQTGRAALSGNVNLSDWLFDVKGEFSVRALDGANRPVGDIPLPVSVTGDIGQPVVSWDKKGAEDYWERVFYGN